MKKLILLFASIFAFLFTSCVSYYKDGGTKTYNSIAYKRIEWHRLDGKNYTETHIFPMSLFPLSYFDNREEKDFEELLKSAHIVALTAIYGYAPLHSLDTYQSSGNKNYDDFVKRGKKTNYFLIQKMLCDEPTSFCIPNFVVPLTDGDIAFMLLTDINCTDDWEKTLIPAEITEKDGYSAADLFAYLHESRENRIEVAKKLLENYIDDDFLKECFEGYVIEAKR